MLIMLNLFCGMEVRLCPIRPLLKDEIVDAFKYFFLKEH